ncbi:40S ribosomal protein S6 [Drosophila sechellia]|uniref:Small ribosomal subunit protein eS6 n=1 Tax=Drosophila sechellia TaxID=7238 RepID=B4IGE8_DROSE|nr:40S ribosomal protein S6 [Drosophila sechellia]EDW48898.1 GM11558 [Drosophila sechellia]EDW48903.1 GM11553 [Drosophila sechellia]
MKVFVKSWVYIRARIRVLKKRHSCFRPRGFCVRKCKTTRRCIVDAKMSVLTLIVIEKDRIPRRLGPMRSSIIRKQYQLSKKKDVRLILPAVMQRKHKKKSQTVSKEAAGEYATLLVQRKKGSKAKRRRSASNRESMNSVSSDKK